MYGLNAVALIVFGAVNLFAVRLCKAQERTRRLATRLICAALLLGSVLRYVLTPLLGGPLKIPVEFSTVAYFIVPIIMLLCTRGRAWAAYSGLMAGFFYYIAMITVGGRLYEAYVPWELYVSMLCHGALYLTGLVAAGTERYRKAGWLGLAFGVACVAAWAALMRPFAGGSGRMLIYELLDAAWLRPFVSAGALSAWMPAYYAAMSGLVLLTIFGFYRKNGARYRRFECGHVVNREA